jgi:hypothetical protein
LAVVIPAGFAIDIAVEKLGDALLFPYCIVSRNQA